MKFKLDNTAVPNGSVLLIGVRYQRDEHAPEGDRRGMTDPKVFTYAMLKVGGLWYVTGAARTPHAAGWGAVERWLDRDGREVAWVRGATEWIDLYPSPVAT